MQKAFPDYPWFLRYKDLTKLGIFRSPMTMKRAIDCGDLAQGRMLSANVRAWSQEEIAQYIATRPTARKAPPLRKKPELQSVSAQGGATPWATIPPDSDGVSPEGSATPHPAKRGPGRPKKKPDSGPPAKGGAPCHP
jgi:predicted DNA-binding transcriptional regulator AlpA